MVSLQPVLLSYGWRGPPPDDGPLSGPQRGASISRPAAVIFHVRASMTGTMSVRPSVIVHARPNVATERGLAQPDRGPSVSNG